MTSRYYLANKEKILKRQKQYKINNPDKVSEHNKARRLRHGDNIKELDKKYNNNRLPHKYGITIEQYNEIFDKQGGKCSICGRHQSDLRRRLCVDHNHATGKIRGLLCNKCNFILGYANDDVVILSKAIDYIVNTI
jgi:hypothetical protein